MYVEDDACTRNCLILTNKETFSCRDSVADPEGRFLYRNLIYKKREGVGYHFPILAKYWANFMKL